MLLSNKYRKITKKDFEAIKQLAQTKVYGIKSKAPHIILIIPNIVIPLIENPHSIKMFAKPSFILMISIPLKNSFTETNTIIGMTISFITILIMCK